MADLHTPHINARKGEIAERVLMPGDPLRAKFIAENYLENAVCYSEIRGMFGYTGLYRGERVSVQGSGMGVSSIGIYSWELYNFYDVNTIIRIGTAGRLVPEVKPRDIVLAQAACHDTGYAAQYRLPGIYAPIGDFELLAKAAGLARERGVKVHIGNVLTAEVYYDASESLSEWAKMGVLAVEMETAALYMNAAYAGKRALCILTVTNDPLAGSEDVAPQERERSLTDMAEIALNTK